MPDVEYTLFILIRVLFWYADKHPERHNAVLGPNMAEPMPRTTSWPPGCMAWRSIELSSSVCPAAHEPYKQSFTCYTS